MLRKILRKIVPVYAILPLCLTALSMLCSYQVAKFCQMLFGFHNPTDLSLTFDILTPFIPGWAWIYIGSYFFWLYVYTTAAKDGVNTVCKLAVADIVGKLICLVLFLAFPTTNVRPTVEGRGLTPLLMIIIYRLDTPTNLFPSIHCFIAYLGTRYILTAKNLKHKTLHCMFSVAGTILVFASTLFTKQHVALDILGAIVVTEIGIAVAGFTPLPRLLEKWNERFTKTSLCQRL